MISPSSRPARYPSPSRREFIQTGAAGLATAVLSTATTASAYGQNAGGIPFARWDARANP